LPSSSGGGALSRRGGDDFDSVRRWTEEVGFLLLRLLFPLLAVVVAGVEAEWILVLWVDPGELRFFGLACEVGWGPLGSRMDLLCCVFFFGVAGLGRFAGVEVVLWFSGFVVAGGVGADSKTPTAVPKY